MEKVVVISGTSHFGLASKVARLLGRECFLPRIFRYGTGDFEVVLPPNMRRKRVFIIQTFLPSIRSACYHLLEAAFLVNAAYNASAEEVNLVVPHLGWDQSDKKWAGRMPIAGELVAAILHQAGMRRFIGVQLHSPQFPAFFPLSTIKDHLKVVPLMVEYAVKRGYFQDAVMVPGDLGFGKIARKIAEKAGIPVVPVEKERVSGDEVIVRHVYGEVKGRRVLLWDDKIVKGTTIKAVVEKLTEMGAREIIVFATHALCGDETIKNLSCPLIQEIVITDTVPQSGKAKKMLPLTIVSIAPLLADAIREISIEGGSVSQLFEE